MKNIGCQQLKIVKVTTAFDDDGQKPGHLCALLPPCILKFVICPTFIIHVINHQVVTKLIKLLHCHAPNYYCNHNCISKSRSMDGHSKRGRLRTRCCDDLYVRNYKGLRLSLSIQWDRDQLGLELGEGLCRWAKPNRVLLMSRTLLDYLKIYNTYIIISLCFLMLLICYLSTM